MTLAATAIITVAGAELEAPTVADALDQVALVLPVVLEIDRRDIGDLEMIRDAG